MNKATTEALGEAGRFGLVGVRRIWRSGVVRRRWEVDWAITYSGSS